MKEKEATNQEKRFINDAIKQGLRIDERGVNDTRPIKISVGPESGQATVQYGSTRYNELMSVFANVSCEIVRPTAANPAEGVMRFYTEFSPMAFPAISKEKTTDLEITLSKVLEKALRKSRAVDTEGLCIVAGEKVWSIKVDVRVLDQHGNVLDCACLATMTALLHFKRPDVSVDGDDVIIHPTDEKSPIPLSIHHIPVCVTFALFGDGKKHVIDPNFEEEMAQEGSITFAFNIHRELCTVSKAGGISMSMEKMLQCATIASSQAQKVTKLMKEALIKPE